MAANTTGVTTMMDAATTCMDVTPTNDPFCFGNITWAMMTGIKSNPTWYADYPVLSSVGGFKAYQQVLHEKVGPSETVEGRKAGRGWNCPAPCNLMIPSCYDILPTSVGQCYNNTLWAQMTGINSFPQDYANLSGLTNQSSFGDFQYALHTKIGRSEGQGWQCPLPCTSTYVPAPTPAPTPAPPVLRSFLNVTSITTTTTTTTLAAGSSMPIWGVILLIVGGILLCCAAVGLFVMQGGGKKEAAKKKRSAPAEVAPAPQGAPARAPTIPQVAATTMTAPPVYTQQTPMPMVAPVRTVATPMPVVQTVVEPQYMVQAAPQYAQPVYAAPQTTMQAQNLFDQLDQNHDGVISREEFNRALGR